MDTMRATITTSDGAELAAWTSCAGDDQRGDTFVLVHGFSLDHSTWAPVANRLVDAGHSVITLDLRGHGQSTLGAAGATAQRLIDDVNDVVRHFGPSQAHLVGHSLGAVIALAARTDSSLSPGLASVTSIAGTDRAIANPVMRLGARLFSSRPGVWLLTKRRTGRMMISTWFAKSATTEQLDEIRLLSARCTQATRVAITDGTSNLDLRPSFDTAGPPTLVLCGLNDTATPLKLSTALAGAIDGAELHAIDDAGHMAIIEQPDAIVEHLLTFIAAH